MHPLQNVNLDEDWSAVLLRPNPQVQLDVKGLQALALRGCWNTMLDSRDEILHSSIEDHAAKKTYLLLASIKTKDYKRAADELAKMDIPITSCSFAVQLLHALLPLFMDQPRTAVDRLTLLYEAKERQNEPRRSEMVLWCLVNLNLVLRHYIESLKWLNQLLTRDPQHQKAWYAVCCIQILLGDRVLANETKSKLTDSDYSRLVAGLLAFAEQDYSGAINHFDQIKPESAAYGVAVNNKSVCELFRVDNTKAMKTLQTSVNAQPIKLMQEPIVCMLVTLYNLRGGFTGPDRSKKLKAWIADLVPDDFDDSMLQMKD